MAGVMMLAERNAIRVSDAEREAAASALGDHLVSGRLDVAEYEERVGKAWSARYAGELAELFVDLPVARPHASVRRGPRPFVLAPMLFVLAAIVTIVAVVNVIPWVFLLVLGMFMFHGARRRRYRYHSYRHYPRRMRTISV